jgi:quercetin dioxygenase-like cupin family protein
VNDGPAKVFRAGENWLEQPGDHHRVSANASDTEPAKLLAVFVVNSDDKNIVIDDPQ